MSYRVVDDLSSPWSSDASGHLSASTATLEESGFSGSAMQLSAQGVGPAGAYVERQFAPALDLSAYSELRFWLRAPRPAQDLTRRPFYLQLTARDDATAPSPGWYRLLPVESINRWQLIRVWLADMPASLRGAVASLRFEALPDVPDFDASCVGLWASAPNALADFEQALAERLHQRFTVATDSGPAPVDAVVGEPSGDSEITTPYLRITPLSVSELRERGGTGRVQYDNYTLDGAHSSQAMPSLALHYAIDAVADTREQGAAALGLAIEELLYRPVQLVAGERVPVTSFEASNELQAPFWTEGRAPFFIRALVPVVRVEREFHTWAEPYLRVGPAAAPESSSETLSL